MTQYMSFAHVTFIRNETNNNEYHKEKGATIEIMTEGIRSTTMKRLLRARRLLCSFG